ncbi:major facilitator superfamily domain-containing protein 6 isoform X2 [Hermetia illucens]|uniref:major facilitator superfamily domain-containing protein 6 isoform X2 n=1 Tax=Hermetia illucens TaxID=343691 RepID=UPI0018CBFDEB|nr:major facilitator superfamily domain-containing protein 6 isoform X2 [Hermetia illucens]
MKPKIDKRLLPMKAHYFLYNAGTAPVVPYMPVYARQLGFSSVVVGTIYTILPVVGLLAKPLFGLIADRFRQQKRLFLIFQILTAIAFFAILFIPSIPKSTSMAFHCNNGITDLRYIPENSDLDTCIESSLESRYKNQTVSCNLNCGAKSWMWQTICDNWGVYDNCNDVKDKTKFQFSIELRPDHMEIKKNGIYFIIKNGIMNGRNTTMYCPHLNNTTPYFKTDCDIKCNDQYIMDVLTESKIQNNDAVGLYQFWLFFMFLIISWAAMAVVVSVGDAICFEMLGDRPHLYGNQRLWGAAGWGVISLFSGYLVDLFSGESYFKDYTVVFYMTLIMIAMDVFVSLRLEHNQTKFSTNIAKDLGKIFLSIRVVVFFVWCILVGLCTALIWNFLFWHLEDLSDMEGNCDSQNWMKTLQGIAMAIQCFGGEIPFFFLSGWILKKIGHINAMTLVLAAFGVRFILYSLLANPWFVLPIELFNGLTFGIFYATMTSYASIVAPPGTEATLQGLVGAIFEGIGVSTGSFIGGLLFRDIGGSKTFRMFGICALCAALIHASFYIILERCGKSLRPNYLPPTDAIHMLDDEDMNFRS